MKTSISHSQEETRALGAAYAGTLKAGDVVAMYGGLGAGKTAFVRGVVGALGCDEPVTSPTFTIVNEYPAASPKVAHFDMYRILDEDSLYSTGFYDYLDGRWVCFIEWSENIPFALDFPHKKVVLDGDGELPRTVTFYSEEEAAI